jgi:hypothetical protein
LKACEEPKKGKQEIKTNTYIGKATHCIIISSAAACSPLWQALLQLAPPYDKLKAAKLFKKGKCSMKFHPKTN